MISASAVKPHLKTLAATGAQTYVIGGGELLAYTPNFTVRVTDELLAGDRHTLSAAKFSAFVSKAKDFTVQKMDSGVRLISGTLCVDFPQLDIKTYDIRPEYTKSIPTTTLKELLAFASCTADAKATMTYSGVAHVEAEPDLFEEDLSSQIKVAASDGYRALKMTIPIQTVPFEMLVPANLTNAVLGFTGDSVEIANTPNYLALKSGAVEAVATKFAVQMPDISGVFPDFMSVKMGFMAEDLKIILGNLNPFLDNSDPDVVMSFEQSLVLSTGSARDELKYTSPTVTHKKFKTPAKYLSDFISKCAGMVSVETDTFQTLLFTNGNKKYLLAGKS